MKPKHECLMLERGERGAHGPPAMCCGSRLLKALHKVQSNACNRVTAGVQDAPKGPNKSKDANKQ